MRRRSPGSLLVGGTLALILHSAPPAAGASNDCYPFCAVSASGVDAGIDVQGAGGVKAPPGPGGGPPAGTAASGESSSAGVSTFEERRVGTACDGSSPDRPDIYCENALGTCPDPAAVR